MVESFYLEQRTMDKGIMYNPFEQYLLHCPCHKGMFSDEYIVEIADEQHFVPLSSIRTKYRNNYCDLIISYVGNDWFKFKDTQYTQYIHKDKLKQVKRETFFNYILTSIKSYFKTI